MDASELREWIKVFMMELQPDGQGGFRESPPSDLTYDRPAKVETQGPGQIVAGDQLADRVRQKITIRWEPGLTTSYRVYWREQFLDIQSVNNVNMADTWNELICERKEAGAQ